MLVRPDHCMSSPLRSHVLMYCTCYSVTDSCACLCWLQEEDAGPPVLDSSNDGVVCDGDDDSDEEFD